MKSHARVVVIGGGVVGCSVLYHLTKLGWNDVMLIERSELTSGSTWHAAGGFHTLNGDTNMVALQGYTIRLYRELEEITSMSCGLHHVGGVTLADTAERLDMLKAERAKHRYMGLETEIVSPEEIQKLSPITNVDWPFPPLPCFPPELFLPLPLPFFPLGAFGFCALFCLFSCDFA